MIDNATLIKAAKIKITPTYISKNKVQHYTIIFYNIPFMDKDHKTLYSEIIYHDCTFPDKHLTIKFNKLNKCIYNIEYNKSDIIINNAQLFLQRNKFEFEYHEQPSTTELITVLLPKED